MTLPSSGLKEDAKNHCEEVSKKITYEEYYILASVALYCSITF
jgi:hypothetical protein